MKAAPKKPHIGRKNLKILIDTRNPTAKKIKNRFYHIFREKKHKMIILAVGFNFIRRVNIYLIIKK
jgi:hypothetical protein